MMMEALRATCMMNSCGVGLADACLPLHGLRTVRDRFKELRIESMTAAGKRRNQSGGTDARAAAFRLMLP
jgi:hypothetical protein